jgi:hypothetical protein
MLSQIKILYNNKMSEEYILYIIRLICLIFLLFIIVNEQIINPKIKEPIIQIIIAFIVMFIFVFVDPLAGFFIACAVFVIYYKYYVKTGKSFVKTYEHKKKEIPYGNYITEEHLDIAQNNIVSDPNNELVPFENAIDVSKLKIFGVQGLNSEIRGYEKPLDNNFILED